MDSINSLTSIINKDFDIENLATEEVIRERLIEAFSYLLDNDISKMMNILYRTDVDEVKLKSLLISNSNLPSAEVIADAYIARQKQKVETRERYRR